jgi:hypothetical protein
MKLALRLTPEQKVLVALVESEKTLTRIQRETGLAWGHLNRVVDQMLDENQEGGPRICRNEEKRTYYLRDKFKESAMLLRYVYDGYSGPITVGKTIDMKVEEFAAETFHEGLKKVMTLILDRLPKVHHAGQEKLLNIENDPCFEKTPVPPEHWFYCHGISTKLQGELGADFVKDWATKCNEREIGEVVINEQSFSDESTWKQMVPLRSHEYWLTLEPVRSEGYIVFADYIAIIRWNEKRCILYKDEKLARVCRTNIKILRLESTIAPRCCREHKQFRANPDSTFYKKMWE